MAIFDASLRERAHRAAPAPRSPRCNDGPRICSGQARLYAGFAPGVPHFANLPLASLQRVTVFVFVGHFMNLPLASRHGAAKAEAEPVRRLIADKAKISFRIVVLHSDGSQVRQSYRPLQKHQITTTQCSAPLGWNPRCQTRANLLLRERLKSGQVRVAMMSLPQPSRLSVDLIVSCVTASRT